MPNQHIDAAAISSLRQNLRGAVLTPGDAGYDEARAVWNARIDRRPAAIARCAGVEEVVAAVHLARRQNLLLAVRSGGHDYAGNCVCDGGLLLDLSQMNQVLIDAAARRARVGPGATWGAFDREAQALGLATTGGTVSTVGVAGFTLGGGSGHLARKHGLALDNLAAAEVVTAEGKVVRASAEQNGDLFWALRGGSGNFGVVTALEFRLHKVGPEVIAGQLIHPFEDAAEVLRFYREFMAQAPDELTCYPFFIRVPAAEPFPKQFHGKMAIDLVVSWVGDIAQGEQVLRTMQEFGRPMLAVMQTQPYTVLQTTFDAGVGKGSRWYSRAHYMPALPDDAIRTILRHAAEMPGPFTMVYLETMGGAIGRVDRAATAFPHRDAAYDFHVLAGWSDAREDHNIMRWTRDFHAAMSPYGSGGVYVNLLGEDEPERVSAAYGPNYARLTQIKRQWDPQNLFRHNHNIVPAGSSAAA